MMLLWMIWAMIIFQFRLIRVEIFIICILFNVWGIAVFIFNTRKLIIPYTYKRYRGDVIEADISENKFKTWDKMSGYNE